MGQVLFLSLGMHQLKKKQRYVFVEPLQDTK